MLWTRVQKQLVYRNNKKQMHGTIILMYAPQAQIN